MCSKTEEHAKSQLYHIMSVSKFSGLEALCCDRSYLTYRVILEEEDNPENLNKKLKTNLLFASNFLSNHFFYHICWKKTKWWLPISDIDNLSINIIYSLEKEHFLFKYDGKFV